MWMYTVGRAILKPAMHMIYHITVSGKEYIPTEKEKGFILAANHISNADPIMLGIILKQQIHYMSKEELFHNKFVAWVLRNIGAFAVARGKGDTGSLDHGADLVKSGKTLGIFPEGTRSKTGELLKPKSGVILIAASTGGDILPASITALPKKRFGRKHVHIQFGPMIKNEELAVDGAKNLARIKAASKLLMGRIADLRQMTYDTYKVEVNKDA